MKENLFLVDDMLCQITEDPLLKEIYGKDEVDKWKKFLKNTNIDVVLEHRVEQAKFPSIAVFLGPGEEDKAKAALGDSHTTELVTPDTLGGAQITPVQFTKGPFTPLTYDDDTGVITFPDGQTTENVFSEQFVLAKDGRSFEIQTVLDAANIVIDSGVQADLTDMKIIQRRPDFVGHNKKSQFTWDTYGLKLAATEVPELIMLFSIVMYALGRYKKPLFDDRGFNVQSFSYSEVYREPEADPNQVWMRNIILKGRVEHSWIESTAPIIEGINPVIKIADMTSPAAVIEQVKAQGWQGEGDE